jgi:hypothetical protein
MVDEGLLLDAAESFDVLIRRIQITQDAANTRSD